MNVQPGHAHAKGSSSSSRRTSGSSLPADDESSEDDEVQRLVDLPEKRAPAAPAKKIDWEIPRKTLHSSIGFFTIYLYTSNGSPKAVVYVLCTALAVIVPIDFLRLRYPGVESLYERCVGFLMRESEKNTTNGVIWYIIGVTFALAMYPLDVATVAVLILSWADTSASTIGRMYGASTPRLPTYVPFLRVPALPFLSDKTRNSLRLRFAGRKSLAGFLAASISGACIAMGFWLLIAPTRPQDVSWTFAGGVAKELGSGAVKEEVKRLGWEGIKTGGWLGLTAIGLVAGFVSGVAEALDLGSMDDNLTLPIISGGCLLGFLKLLGLLSS